MKGGSTHEDGHVDAQGAVAKSLRSKAFRFYRIFASPTIFSI